MVKGKRDNIATSLRSVALLFLVALSNNSYAESLPEESEQDTTAFELSDVVVTGTRSQIDSRHLPYNVTVVQHETLTAKEQLNVLPTLTQRVPGLFTTARGVFGYGVSTGASGDITMRGLGSGAGRVMVLVDGHPQYQGIFGHGISDSYQSLMAERVEVLRGPASTLYGSNALAGVVNIVTRQMHEDGVHTTAGFAMGSHNTIQADVQNQARKGRFFSTAAAQYGVSQNHRENMGFEQYGGFVKLGYDFTDNWRAFVDADITHFNAQNPGAENAPKIDNKQHITRGVLNLCVENNYDRTRGAVSVYDNFGRHRINDGYAPGGTEQTSLFRSVDHLVGFNAYQSASLWKGGTATLGLDYQHIYGHAYYTDRATGAVLPPTKAVTEQHFNEVAAYADVRQDLFQWLTLNAGVRFDHHSQVGGEWIPQGGVVVRPCNNGALKATVGKGFRNPTMKEMYLYGPANEDLLPERLMNYELAWTQRFSRVNYGVNVFYMKADNLIQTVAMKNVNTGELSNCGVEGDLQWNINEHWALQTNHSYLHMKNPVVASPEYKGFIGADMQYGKWSASLGFQQLVGLYTAVGANESKCNASLLDAMVAFQAHRTVRFYARGENLLAQKYEINAGYPMPRATFMIGMRVNL